MERRILQVVVIRGDEDGEGHEEQRHAESVESRTLVCEAAVAGDASRVDHGQLVDELHGVFEGCVKEQGAGADGGIAGEGDDEDTVVLVVDAGLDALDGEEDEEEVGEGVDDFGGNGRRPIVLWVVLVV